MKKEDGDFQLGGGCGKVVLAVVGLFTVAIIAACNWPFA